MLPHARKRHRRLGLYLIVTCLLLGGFLMRIWYGFDRPDETTGVGDRIVTVTVFYAPSAGSLTWYLSERDIVFLNRNHRFGNQTDEVVPLKAEDLIRFREAVAKIPAYLLGTYTNNRAVCDGLYIDVAFTPDGMYRHDEIGAHHVFIKELDPLFKIFNELLAEGNRIDYNDSLNKQDDVDRGMYCDVVRMSQSDMNRWNSSFLPFTPPINPIPVPAEEIFLKSKVNNSAGEPIKLP